MLIRRVIYRPLDGLRRASQQFSEAEAWQLFKLAALGEAIGWTLLIVGIATTTYLTPGNRDAVIIAGQIHGIIFLVYIVAALLFSFRLRWPPLITVLAVAASVPPYGSLLFEMLAAYWQQTGRARVLYRLVLLKSFPSQ